MNDMKTDKFLTRRVCVLIVAMGLWGAAIGTRLYFLHIVYSADYKQRAERQQQRTLEVSPRRGVIYDRNGSELAVSIKADSIFGVPDEIEDSKSPGRASITAKTLSALIGVSREELLRKFDKDGSFVWIKRKLNPAEAAAV